MATVDTVNAVYQAVVRTGPPPGYATAVAAQIDSGSLSFSQFSSNLIATPTVQSTTIPALVLYDAFYGSTENSGGLTFVTNEAAGLYATGGTTEFVYSSMGSWFALGANNFSALYGPLDRTTYIQTIYQNVFGTGPSTDAMNYLLGSLNSYVSSDQAAGLPNAELLGRGSVFGDLLYLAQTANTGNYAPGSSAFMNDLVSSAEANTTPTVYTETLSSIAPPTLPPTVNLTTGIDHVTANSVSGSLTLFAVDGIGPTLNSGDTIAGLTGASNNTLTINDAYGLANDVIPTNVQITNEQNIILDTNGNAGGTALFDTSGISGEATTTVVSSGGGNDNVKVNSTASLTITHNGVAGSVQTYGGSAVTVTSNAGNPTGGLLPAVNIGSSSIAGANPSGPVQVTAAGANVTVLGGSTVNVTNTGLSNFVDNATFDGLTGGSVTVGIAGASLSPAEPTGAVTINTPTSNPISAGLDEEDVFQSTQGGGLGVTDFLAKVPEGISDYVYGGTDATVTAAGGAVGIGALVGSTVFAPSGNITVTDQAAVPYEFDYNSPDTFAALKPQNMPVSVLGGNNVTVTTNIGDVVVGGISPGTTASALTPGQNPTGAVSVTDTADIDGVLSDDGLGGVTVYSGTSVNVVGGGLSVTVGDATGIVAPSGPITISDNAPVVYDQIVNDNENTVAAYGGTSVTITTNAGDVLVGTETGTTNTEPLGTVTVTDTSVGDVEAYGGTDVMVNSSGGFVIVGSGAKNGANPSGNVTVTESAVQTGGPWDTDVTINGGVAATVNTTGGSVTAGTMATPVTGAVSITDTYGGASSDSFDVWGGTTVSLTTTATSGHIYVGANPANPTPKLNSAGTGLANPLDYPSGDVVISDGSLATSFGTGAVFVTTNGSTSVSVTGGGSATIRDAQTALATGGAGAGKAIGTSTLATVSLDGVGSGASTITSDVLSSLTVADSAKASATNVTVNQSSSSATGVALGLTVSNDAKGTSVTDNTAPSVTVSTSGTASDELTLSAAKATALTFNQSAALTIDTMAGSLAKVATITDTGSASLVLNNLTGATTSALTTIDASGATGAVTADVNPLSTAFTGGAGNDTLILDNDPFAGTPKNSTGGGGTNTLVANYAAAGGDGALFSSHFLAFSNLGLGANAVGTYNATGFSGLTVGAVAGPVNFDQVSPVATLAITATPGSPVQYTLNDKSGTSDALSLTVGQDVSATSTGTKGVAANVILANDVPGTDHGIVNLTVFSQGITGATPPDVNTVNIVDTNFNPAHPTEAALQAIAVTGDENLVLTYVPTAGLSSSVTSIDAGSPLSTGDVDVSGVVESSSGVTIKGSAGKLTADGSGVVGTAPNPTALDAISTGSGGGVITVGYGGSWNGATNAYGTGSETINLTASTAKSDTIKDNPGVTSTFNGAVGGISGFQTTASNADVISLWNTHTALFNPATGGNFPTSPTAVTSFVTNPGYLADLVKILGSGGAANLANLAFTSSNGQIIFSGVGIHTLAEFSDAQLIAAASAIVTEAASLSGREEAATFTSGANTYVAASDAFGVDPNANHIYGAAVDELNGVSGISGFGYTAAAGVIEMQGLQQVLANNGTGNNGTALGATYNDAGYSEDTLNAGAAGATNTYNNLGASAQIDVGAGGDQGNLVTTQAGTSGSDSITINFTGSTTLDSATVSGDDLVVIHNPGFASVITSLVDATNTVTTVDITGAGATTLGGISDSFLTKVDAHTDTGFLTLTASQSSLMILGATGGDIITANGSGDTITVGDVTHPVNGDVTITALGSGDHITVTNEGGGVHATNIGASADLDVISLDVGINNVVGDLAHPGAIGSGDMVSFAAGNGVAAATDTVWVGAGNTVNLGTTKLPFAGVDDDSAHITVTGAVTGATSSGTVAMTTINGAGPVLAPTAGFGSLSLTFNNATHESWAGGSVNTAEVNMSSASSVPAAFDLAANQSALVDARLLGADHNTTISHGNVLLDANTGLLTWFQFGGNTYIEEAVNSSSSAAAHTALGAGDVVVELTGLINLDTAHNFHLNPV